MSSSTPALLLASSSIYRRELLSRLQLPFTCHSPNLDESPLPNETPLELAQRLALSKARALAKQYPEHLIIGSDQVAVLDNTIIGKPHHAQAAFNQLRSASGRSVSFLTAIAVLDTRAKTKENIEQVDCIPFTVHFRSLSDAQIWRYIDKEQPFDCAGSFKSEGLGVSLFEATEGTDATSLIGLPLIRLCDMLNTCGISIP
ncbi:nucleoside triphosphate pyrophosphatase [Denitrificimonas sp. JX-1]|uniref:7-methyl-GTP pyrophosphatase n=1 Tax=Denitrificimonas halotolerans TaxID=3098930 RepID=A0ABU5GPM0_9GAMM|nr:nucleoside triphosphate pyrophosphatase [Denitrificimonas sp. JX-1]MDY7218116.1 nucleoside triphosphate pyrophosphatase [Denitrificimonas sp. JX-1]